MAFASRDTKTTYNQFLHGMQKTYYAEKQVLKALPELIHKAANHDLRSALTARLAERENHMVRFGLAFDLLGEKARASSCLTIDRILDEVRLPGQTSDKMLRDTLIIIAATAVESYANTRYRTLIAWARELDKESVAILLTPALVEVRAAEQKLSAIAEQTVDVRVAALSRLLPQAATSGEPADSIKSGRTLRTSKQ